MLRKKQTLPKKPKYKMGDTLLVSLDTYSITRPIWIGVITGIMGSSYSVECLLPDDITHPIRIPFLLHPFLKKIPKSKIKKTIKSLKVLYF